MIRTFRARCFPIERSTSFRGHHKGDLRTDFKLGAEQRRKKMIFVVIQTARCFLGEIARAVPFVMRLTGASGVHQIKRYRAIEALHLHTVLNQRDLHAPVAGLGQGMKVAIVHERF